MFRSLFASAKKLLLWMLLFALLLAAAFVYFPGLKYSLYRVLPPKVRWDISYAVSDKFLVGMVYFVERGDQLLLVKHSYQDKWGLPGGWLDKNETFEQSVRRELREELGVGLTNIEMLEVHKIPSSQIIDIAVRGQLQGDKLKIGDGEIAEFRFFDKDALPAPADILYPHRPYIERYLAGEKAHQRVVVH
ncbi:NUDIX domain-containing protein [Microbulbifer sp. SAOS-129_SWC]|uniref:NUDIX hydrolase n=1 Tax=Microbulbifer sp. SAOS-129_SWC TaxID=3145235 RepID=UPI00321777B7